MATRRTSTIITWTFVCESTRVRTPLRARLDIIYFNMREHLFSPWSLAFIIVDQHREYILELLCPILLCI
jgi:hypothetical protein